MADINRSLDGRRGDNEGLIFPKLQACAHPSTTTILKGCSSLSPGLRGTSYPGFAGFEIRSALKGLNRAVPRCAPLQAYHQTKASLPRLLQSLLVLSLLCLSGCKGKQQATAPPPPTVEVVAVAQSDVPIY